MTRFIALVAFATATAYEMDDDVVMMQSNIRTTTGDEKDTNERKLILCNTFTSENNLVVTLRRTAQKLALLKYKECQSATAMLEDGDHFDFQDETKGPALVQSAAATTSDSNESDAVAGPVGSFLVKALPQPNHALLLIVDKQAGGKAGFVSHAFDPEPEDGAQVAVIDTYSGASNQKVQLHIKSPDMPATDLYFNGVATISAGMYTLDLDGTDVQLEAKNHTNYVIIRTGADGEQQGSALVGAFPQSLIVFPRAAASSMTAISLGAFLIPLLVSALTL
jgi:hypothetical protein